MYDLLVVSTDENERRNFKCCAVITIHYDDGAMFVPCTSSVVFSR